MTRRIISHAEFAGLEGGSRRLSDMSEGPKSGYYVARDPDKPIQQGGSFEATVKDTHPEDVKAHFDLSKEAGAETARPEHKASEVYQGTWASGGQRYLDVSDRYSASTSGLMHALQHGMANVQLAAWDAHNQREVPITESTEDSQGNTVKTGVNPRARMVANALHAQAVRRARMR